MAGSSKMQVRLRELASQLEEKRLLALGSLEVVLVLAGAVGELDPALADAGIGQRVDAVVVLAAGRQLDPDALPGRATVLVGRSCCRRGTGSHRRARR